MKNWLLLCLCLLPLFSIGQVVTVSEDISIRNDKAYDLIGKMKDRILLYREKSNKVEIQAFDERLRLSWDKELKLDHKRANVLSMIPDRDKFSIIYKYKKKGNLFIKLHKYSPGAQLTDSTTIITHKQRFVSRNYQVVYSEDKKSILLFAIEKQKKVKALAYNIETMSLLWESNFTLPDAGFYQSHMEVVIANSGDMYFVVSQNNRRSKREEHFYQVYHARQGISKVETFELHMEGKLSYDIQFSFDNLNKTLVAGGLYSNKNTSRANGHFSATIPISNPKNYVLRFEAFDDVFISDLEGKKVNNGKGVEDVEIREIVLRRDGGMLLIYEKTKLYERSSVGASRGYRDSEGLGRTIDYYHDNLFVISIHPSGETHWKTILYKKQYSQDDNAMFSSYFLLKTPSSLRLIFNDEIRFENTVSEYVLLGNGEYDRNSVLSTENQDIRLRFQDAMQIGSKDLLIPSERRNRLRLVRVTY